MEKPRSHASGLLNLQPLCLGDFAALDTACADANFAGCAADFGLDRAQVHAPAAARNVVRVRNVVTELRTLAADFTNLCHDESSNKPELFGRVGLQPGRGRRTDVRT